MSDLGTARDVAVAAGRSADGGGHDGHDDGGHPVGLDELYAAHRLSLVRLALLLVDDLASAEDVVHDAFARMAARRTPLRDPHASLAYLRTSVVNGSRSALRRRRVARAYTPPTDVPRATPEDAAVLAEEHRAVLDGLALLGRRQREVLVLRYWSGLSESDIAATLGISRGTVKSTASRALDALEKVMTQEDEA